MKRLRTGAENLATAAAYTLLVQVGLAATALGSAVSPFWPAAGLALALCLRRGLSIVPGLFVAAVGTILAIGVAPGAALLVGVVNTALPLAGALLLRRLGFRRTLERAEDVVLLAGVALLLPIVPSLLGAASETWLGTEPLATYWTHFRVWWVGDALGILVAAPLALLAPWPLRLPAPGRPWDLLGLGFSLAVISLLVFAMEPTAGWRTYAEPFLAFPLLAWAAMRFGPPGAAAASAFLGLVAFVGTARGLGPFAGQEVDAGRFGLGLFLAVAALSSLLLAAVNAARARAAERVALLAAAIRTSEDAVLLARRSDELEVEFANESFARLCRRTEPSASPVGRSLRALLADQTESAAVAPFFEAARAGRPHRGELQLLGEDGARVPVEVHLVPVRRSSEGEPSHLAINVRHIGERLEMQSQLALAERMASVGTLAAGVAHEINNPLAFVMANLRYLADELEAGAPQPELREAVSDALGGAERIRRIVTDLRVFSRDGEAEGQPGSIELEEALDLAVRMAVPAMRPLAELVERRAPTPPVVADVGRIGQVVLNLLVNAAHSIPPDAVVRRVELRTGTTADGWAQLEVEDTGSGIDPAVLPRIFEPFFTTKEVGRGTGLGLSICHRIVTAYGGAIDVQSRLGKGTTVRVRLPPAPAGRPTTPAAAAAPAVGPVEPRRILVVDDEELVGQGMARLLQPHEVELVVSGEAAIRRIDAGARYDAILCDLHMPGLTGMELYRVLCDVAPGEARKLIFMTGGAVTAEAQRFLATVDRPVLGKPVARHAVDGALASLLGDPA